MSEGEWEGQIGVRADQEGAAQAVGVWRQSQAAGAAPSWSLLRIDLSSPSAFADGEVNALLAIRGFIVWFSEKPPAFPDTSPFLNPIFPPDKPAGA